MSDAPFNEMQQRTGKVNAILNLFNNAKTKFSEDISIATLAYVKEVTREFADGYGIVNLMPVPQWDADGTNYIGGYFFSNITMTVGKLVLVIFTDRDFRTVIETGTDQSMKTTNLNIHSKNFGVVIEL